MNLNPKCGSRPRALVTWRSRNKNKMLALQVGTASGAVALAGQGRAGQVPPWDSGVFLPQPSFLWKWGAALAGSAHLVPTLNEGVLGQKLQRTSSRRWALPTAPRGGPSDVPPTEPAAPTKPSKKGTFRNTRRHVVESWEKRRAVRPGPSMPTPPRTRTRGSLAGAKPVALRSAAPSEDSQGPAPRLSPGGPVE